MKFALMSATLLAAMAVAPSAQAVVVFQDNFDSESGGSILNYNAFANWDVTFGTVDKIASGGFGITCAGGTGQCVDMDGSTRNAGVMTTKQTFNFNAGDIVTLMVDYTGNQRAAQTETISFNFSPFFSSFITIGQGAIGLPFTTYSKTVVVAADTVGSSLSIFQPSGSGSVDDNVGPIIDNVVIDVTPSSGPSDIPVPPSLMLFGSAIALAGWAAYRRKA